MSDKRKRPVTAKLITSGLRSGFLEMGTSLTTPLEFQVLSPTGIINYEIGRVGIGLGIVVALEKSNENIPAKKSNFRKKASIFDISPARFGDDDKKMCRASEFLSSCHLCNKRLHGKDIYMYRGDKAFCSPQCRSKQIGMDERVETQCSSQASSSPSNATSSHLLTTGIFAI